MSDKQNNFHKLLKRQIRNLLPAELSNSPLLENFLNAVNDSYTAYDNDKDLVNHAFHISEEEYKELYKNLHKEHELKKNSIEKLKQAIKQIDQKKEVKFNDEEDDLFLISEYITHQIIRIKETKANLTRALNLLTTLVTNLNSGILVEDENRHILYSNQLFCDMFSIPLNVEQMKGLDCSESAEQNKHLFKNPESFVSRIGEILKNRVPVLGDELELKNGKIYKRDYIPIYIDNEYKGHLWDYFDITESKNFEKQQVRLANMQNAILNGTDYSIIYTDQDGLIKSFNKGAEKMLGYQADEMISWHTPAIIHDEGEIIEKAKELSDEFGFKIQPGFDVFVAKAKKNSVDTNEWTYIKKDGTRLTVLLSVSAIKDADAEITGFLGIARDITEQKIIQHALEESEERYRDIVEKSTEVIYKTNEDGFFLYANQVAEKITGYSTEELFKMRYTELIPKEKRKATILHYIQQIKEKKTTSYYEFPIITKSGEEKWIGQSVQLTQLENGSIEFTALAIDITERVYYEKTILRQKEKYHNIITNMKLGLLEVDLDSRILFANPSFLNISGYEIEDLIQKKSVELFIPDSSMDLIRAKIKDRNNGISDMYELPVKNKKGELRWWMISGAPNYDEKGKQIGSVGIYLDITEKKQLEIELELAKSKAEESAKAKESFLANMSHEIRTPLNAIIGMIRELSKQNLSPIQNEYVQNTSVASQHLLSVLNSILDISKIEAGELQLDLHDFNLITILNDVKSIMTTRADEKKIFLKINHHTQKNYFFVGDSSRFRQILINLIGNAIKFTSHGGVLIDYSIQDINSGFQSIQLSIKDTGIGMEEKYLKNIFNKFSQEDASTSRRYGGSGLGMAITHELVQLMNGSIKLESKKNEGTTIFLQFLLPIGDELKVLTDSIAENSHKLDQAKILLVEDNEYNRKVAYNALSYYKCIITEVENGQEAIERLRSGSEFDLILMDLQMPIMDGFEATKQIRNELKLHIPIIALTANAFKSELEQCIKIGMNDFVTKPFEEDKLIGCISKWIKIDTDITRPTIQPRAHADSNTLYSLDKLMISSRNDVNYVKKMMQIFIEQTQLAIVNIKEAYHAEDLQTVFKIIHRIKPSIDSMGIEVIKNEVREVEKLSKEGINSEELKNKIFFILTILHEAIEQLEKDKGKSLN